MKKLIILLFIIIGFHIFIIGFHNKPYGCVASVASAAGPFTPKRKKLKYYQAFSGTN
jgi:hypothetical protein